MRFGRTGPGYSQAAIGLSIRFGRGAVRDLTVIHDYLHERSPRGADRVRQRILHVVNRLAELPSTGRPTENPRIRVAQLTDYPYRIYYAADEAVLTILHVRHTSRAPIDINRL